MIIYLSKAPFPQIRDRNSPIIHIFKFNSKIEFKIIKDEKIISIGFNFLPASIYFMCTE
jgi:hypothetical protein